MLAIGEHIIVALQYILLTNNTSHYTEYGIYLENPPAQICTQPKMFFCIFVNVFSHRFHRVTGSLVQRCTHSLTLCAHTQTTKQLRLLERLFNIYPTHIVLNQCKVSQPDSK